MLHKPLKTKPVKPSDALPVSVIFQARERGLRGQRIGFTDEGLKGRIVSQRVRVIAVLVACRDLVDPLTEHLISVVFDEPRMALVLK